MAKKTTEKDVLIVCDEKTGEISVVAGLNADGSPKRTPAKAENAQSFLQFDRHGDGTSGGTLGEHGLGDEDGCRRKTVLRKRPCGDGGDIADEKGKIRAAFLTESGTRGGETKAFGSGGHVAILTNR